MSKNLSKEQSLKNMISRLHSNDANDRVKAAAELGEVGTPEQAPELLKAAYEDEASTVRQMAIQAYAEILENDALDEILKAARDHVDNYVRMYAINVLGNMDIDNHETYLEEFLNFENEKLKATVLRAMIHAETSSLAPLVYELLKTSEDQLIIRNCIEALALWKYERAQSFINKRFFEQRDNFDNEIVNMTAFYLSIMGNKDAFDYLKNSRVDSLMRISYNDEIYRGKDGMLKLVKLLK